MSEMSAVAQPPLAQSLFATERAPRRETALDRAREERRGEKKLGTTGRGIGPAYEDKVGRRAIRIWRAAP